MQHIRLASKEEVEKIRETSDLGENSAASVLALENRVNEPNIAVLRQVVEMDPVIFAPSTNDLEKAKFVYALEERLLGAGVREYYFNVLASDEHWQKIVTSWGAFQVSKFPELRFKRTF